MKRILTGSAMAVLASAASAAPQTTDFGVRSAPSATPAVSSASASGFTAIAHPPSSISLSSAVAVASRLGRVTSTRRSASRNRAVGGAPNSFHLRGRAIDVVPRRGVRHSDIEAALRRAGFNLLESLNEGDHSHFAFGSAPLTMVRREPAVAPQKEVTPWRIVSAPRLASR